MRAHQDSYVASNVGTPRGWERQHSLEYECSFQFVMLESARHPCDLSGTSTSLLGNLPPSCGHFGDVVDDATSVYEPETKILGSSLKKFYRALSQP
jgi:hypothetical protein